MKFQFSTTAVENYIRQFRVRQNYISFAFILNNANGIPPNNSNEKEMKMNTENLNFPTVIKDRLTIFFEHIHDML